MLHTFSKNYYFLCSATPKLKILEHNHMDNHFYCNHHDVFFDLPTKLREEILGFKILILVMQARSLLSGVSAALPPSVGNPNPGHVGRSGVGFSPQW